MAPMILIAVIFAVMGHASSEMASVAKAVEEPSSLQVKTGLGFPSLFHVRLEKVLSEKHRVGLQLGAAPVGIIPSLLDPIHNDVSDDYSVDVKPSSDILTPSVYWSTFPWGEETFLTIDFTLLLVDAGGTARLVNNGTGKSASVANLDVILYQPIITASLGYRVIQKESWALEVGFGLSIYLKSSIKSLVSGPLPNYLDVVPESQVAVDEGIQDAENEIRDNLNRLIIPDVLPAFFVSFAF